MLAPVLALPLSLTAALSPLQEQEARSPELAACARVKDERALESVRALVALGPRMGGTPSGDRAAAWLAERFREAGLAVEVVEDPEKLAHHEAGFSVRAEAHAAGGKSESLEFDLGRAWPWGYSPSAEGSAPLGLEAAEGNAWLTSRLPRSRDEGPKPALVLVDGSTTLDGSWPLARHLPERTDNPFPVFGIAKTEGVALRELLAKSGSATIHYRLESTIAPGKPRTVIARLAAREGAPAGYLLFCAHGDSDSGGPGADDNASGEAVLLEIARAWVESIAAGESLPPAREVRFAVWGSEIHSTRAFLERAKAAGELPLAVINYDQAGFGSGADQLNIEPDDLAPNAALVRLLSGMLDELSAQEGFPRRHATNKSLGGTDSYVFSEDESFRAAGRASVTLFVSAWGEPAEHPRTPGMPGESWSERELVTVDYDIYYHSAGDRPELTVEREPWNMGWCARAGLAGAMRCLAALENPGPR